MICNACYLKESSQSKKDQGTLYVNPMVSGFEIHDKVLTPEEIKSSISVNFREYKTIRLM